MEVNYPHEGQHYMTSDADIQSGWCLPCDYEEREATQATSIKSSRPPNRCAVKTQSTSSEELQNFYRGENSRPQKPTRTRSDEGARLEIFRLVWRWSCASPLESWWRRSDLIVPGDTCRACLVNDLVVAAEGSKSGRKRTEQLSLL